MTRPLVVVASLLCLSAGSLAAQAPSAPVARAVRISAPPVIDGRLDDSAWQGVAPATGFVQHEPFEGRPATERTEVRILYDDEALYVGAWLLDRSPGQIVVGEVRRDVDLANLDAFIMVLDTYRDRQNAFVFGTSPAGVEYDGQVTREGEGGSGQGTTRQTGGSGGGLNLNWDGSWTVRTSRDSAGWYAEFRIPFATLRYRRGEGQVWGLNFTRNIQRVNERSTWTPLPREFSVYRISAFGALEGLEPPAGRVATATPYVLGSVRRDYARPDTDTGLDIGGDVKLGLSSSMTLDLTANTDFAQVEVDEQQLNLTRFNLFFPEKRPFFLENAGTFSVGTAQSTELFFSRRIGIGADRREVPLLGGGRLSGNIGGLTIGVLDIQADSREGVPANNFAAVRVVQQLPSRSRLGAIAVSRLNTDSTADYNLTFGLDGRMGIGRYLLLDGYAAQTETPGRTGPQHAYHVGGTYSGRNWQFSASWREVARDFNPEVGFLSRSNTRFASVRIQTFIRMSESSALKELRPHISYRENIGFDGLSETRLIHFDSHFDFKNGAFFQLPAFNLTREGLRVPFEIAPGVVIPAGTYDNAEWGFEYYTSQNAPVALSGRIDLGGFYSGRRIGTGSTLRVRTGKTAASLAVSWYDITLPEGEFTAALVGLKLAYSFTPGIYLQSLAQYSNQSRTVQANLRFGWLSRAGTGLFLVYNDIERTGTGSGPEQRAFLVKFTRMFDLN